MSKLDKDSNENDIQVIDSTVQLNFSLKRYIIEEHKPTPVYAVRFCDIDAFYSSYFASVGSNCVSIYNVTANNVNLIQGYLDEDCEEIYYSCAWGSTSRCKLALIVAGFRGILKVINCLTYEIDGILVGHGNAINDLRVHPIQNSLVFSASKDESVRLWNIETNVCIAVFSGEKGHRDEILCVDPHPLGNCFVSAGMDTSIKIWGLEEPRIKNAIEASFNNPKRIGNRPFLALSIQIPLFSTTQVHSDYVDSVRWVGNCILSKSTKNRVALWAPDSDRYKGAPLVLREFIIMEGNLWFVRMDVCIVHDILAVGNRDGRVFVFNLSHDGDSIDVKGSTISNQRKRSKGSNYNSNEANDVNHIDLLQNVSSQKEKENRIQSLKIVETLECDNPEKAIAVLSHPKCKTTVRQVAFHPDGKYIIYSCDDGSISVWDIIAKEN